MKADTIKIIAMSDTHDLHHKINIEKLPEADIFIHAGEFTYYGQEKHFHKFFNFLDNLQFKHKIVISGNHQIMLDAGNMDPKWKK